MSDNFSAESDLRDRIAQVLTDFAPTMPKPEILWCADAVLAELDLENRIEIAIQGYAQSEMGALSYHDPYRKETAYEAMEKLNREASQLGRYAMTYRKRDDG